MKSTTSISRTSIAFLLLLIVFGSSVGFAQEAVQDAWRYVMQKPADGWHTPEFVDRSWRQGFGGFGTVGTPGARIGTVWSTNGIWLRKRLELSSIPPRPALLIHHDEDAEVFINGQQVAELKGFLTDYKVVPLEQKAIAALVVGKNLLAVHCSQRSGGQFIDVHLIDADKVPKLPPPKRQTEPFKSALITQWGEQVTAENAWQEYPRPALARKSWTNLNGNWDYAVTPRNQTLKPNTWNGKILVPYCLESRLSGVQRLLDPTETLWYRRTFEATPNPARRVILNFEAVDYRCRVWVNDTEIGQHTGGNDPFSFDITSALRSGINEVVVRVEDDTEGAQLNGKQTLSPRGIWYTQVSGIWQTVWLEEVPLRYIADLKIATDAAAGTISIRPILAGPNVADEQISAEVQFGEQKLNKKGIATEPIVVTVPNPMLWSPDSPHLYLLTVGVLDRDGQVVDEVTSYAGIRTVGKVRDEDGYLRFTLNGKPIFHFGPLDQGWWPDGLLTPPSDAAMLFDIEFLKSAGFNMIRKHIKVEPRRYYYHCDRVGMLVWQDQVSGGPKPAWTRLNKNPKDAQWIDRDHAQFMYEFEEMVSSLENHPSIVVWTPFNEAWGQHRTLEVGKWIVARDPSRIVNIASGGNFWPVGHIVDEHRYPHPGFPFDAERYKDYIMVVGEFGGHGLPVAGHLWDSDRDNWGYGGLPKNAEEYKQRYLESIRLLLELKLQGIAAGVYTQTTDVEGEINGLVTYDRKSIKIPVEELKRIHRPLTESAE